MTNKLPVVGKRYRNRFSKTECLLVFISEEQKQCVIDLGRTSGGLMIRWLETFSDDFEELQEDNSNQEHTSKTHQLEENTPAEKAKEELRIELEYPYCYSQDMKEKAKNLLNTLDSQEPKKETKLPWKPVSELPEDNYTVVIKFKDGGSYFGNYREENQIFMDQEMKYLYSKKDIKEYCLLTDFINQHNSLLDRVERLERIIGGKNE